MIEQFNALYNNLSKGLFMFLKFPFIYLFIFLFISACTHKEDNAAQNVNLQKPQSEVACSKLGEELIITGGSPGRSNFAKPCCDGLSSISQPDDAAQGAAPGRMICASCGDGKCDLKYENSFNCSDCK